ncbi:fumarate hydratase [Pedobacter jejuensis]|uniref:Fumarate hydratase n=1 Tax=Pedobacter jejuensis TaxID=1268550 RepID=A0A3N0BLQ8_9SPHI|nr:fumarate hydratase [Pedobacter jejuensis]RNL49689.1 fumarate hydratase [Pedobacter jejuensis]
MTISINKLLDLRITKRYSRLRFLYIILFTFSIFQLACSPRPNIQGKGEAFMQGVWNEDSVAFSNKLNNYTQHHFKITCDSIYIDLETHSKVNFYEDSCYNNGVWKEYAKGVYAVKGDTLFVGATFTHANYKQKISGCYRIGRYDKNFLIKSKTSDTLLLESLSDRREIKLSLKEKVTCVQKEL